MAGENSCEWASWFKAHHESGSYQKVPSTFDQATWQMEHTTLLNKILDQLEAEGKPVFTESQNHFTLRGRMATLGGKPDLIVISGEEGAIFDAKTGQPRASDHIQVTVYMYAIPLASRQYRGRQSGAGVDEPGWRWGNGRHPNGGRFINERSA